MARKSTIDTLPPDILERLQELLRDPRISQIEATELINVVIDAQSAGDAWPPEIRQKVLQAISDVRVSETIAANSIRAILDWVSGAARAISKVSKSAVNRYWKDMEEVGRDLRESSEVAKVWIEKIGVLPQGDVGLMTTQIIRTLSFDISVFLKKATRGELTTEEAPAVVRMIRDLAMAQEKLEKSLSENEKRAAEIRKQARAQAAEQAAQSAKAGGVSDDTIERIRRDVLGMAA